MPEPKPAPNPFQPQTMKTVKIRENLYFTTGGAGAHTGFFAGKNGVLAIDAKMTPESGAEFVSQIKEQSQASIARMIITHSDLDHVNGLGAFPKGMKITAHKNTRRDMEEAFRDPALANLNDYLPNDTFEQGAKFTFEGAEVQVFHFGPAHTAGDAVVLFKKEKVAFAGDLITFGRDPLIHLAKGGSASGLVKNLKGMLGLDAEVFLPGHNDPCGKQEIRGLIESVEAKIARVIPLVKQGKTFEEVKQILNVQERALPSGRKFPSFEEAVFKELQP